VRASTADEASSVAQLLDDVAPRVRDLLPDVEDGSVEVWVEVHLAEYAFSPPPDSTAAFTLTDRRRIHLQSGHKLLQPLLAHEVVHALLGESWNSLPGVVEEGLADLVGIRLFPSFRGEVRLARLLGLAARLGPTRMRLKMSPPPDQALSGDRLSVDAEIALHGDRPTRPWSLREALAISAEDLAQEEHEADRVVLRGLGFLLAERIVDRTGFDGLHELCIAAAENGESTISFEALLEAAVLEPEITRWRDASTEAWGYSELEALAVAVEEDLASMMARGLQLIGAPDLAWYEDGWEEDGWDIRLGLPDTGTWIFPLELPSVRAATAEAMASTPSSTGISNGSSSMDEE
jgi:hypothetical protein